MRKNVLIFSAILLILVAGVIAYLKLKPAPTPLPDGQNLVLPATGYDEHTDYYDITTDYATSTPLLTTAGAQADANARSVMLSFVRDTVNAFKKDGNFDNLSAEDIKMLGFDQGRKYVLEIGYELKSSPKTISYVYSIGTDTLGAHGNMYYKTFTFGLKTGKLLSLGDLFSGTTYLNTLSTITRAKLPGEIGEFTDKKDIEEGTTPQEENFANFYLDTNALVLLFPPYQVAAYAAGPQELKIPKSELTILKAEYK